jgi:hypothetical protein
MKLIKKWLGSGLPDLSSLLGRMAADLAFDAVQCTDSIDRLYCDRRRMNLMDIVELAARMRLIPSSG